MRKIIKTPYISAKNMKVAAGLIFLCGLILGFDVAAEAHNAFLSPSSLTATTWLHIALESFATLGMAVALWLMIGQIRAAIAACSAETERMRKLKGEFDIFLHDRFHSWGLSPAEIDVALLTVRGLKITEVAAARETREGTIKSQLSMIFKKSGVANRTEFVAQFIDEFLDISTQDSNHPPSSK